MLTFIKIFMIPFSILCLIFAFLWLWGCDKQDRKKLHEKQKNS